ncbi:hypothetical protein K445DRAFT_20378 [Daldinia sp. EC12]|nr:hypothetical protein K445DRAFT_20378 [Daldinia sp. EC12]
MAERDIGYHHCDPPAPDIFYCLTGTNCIVLAANTTVLCCPDTSQRDCININPIACDLNQQTPLASVQTTVRQGTLYSCGTGCCPWGYHCGEGDTCFRDADQSKPPLPLRVTTNIIVDHPATTTSSLSQSSLPQSISTTFDTSFISQSPSSSLSGSPSISITANVEPTPESDQTTESSDSTLSTAEIAGISVAGLSAVVLVALGVYFIRRMRKSTKDSSDDEKSQDTVAQDTKEPAKLPDSYRELHGTPVFELSG